MKRSVTIGRCYTSLAKLRDDGIVSSFESQQSQNRRWGFLITMSDGDEYYFSPRETLAFVEGLNRRDSR